MPTSIIETVQDVIGLAQQLRPQSILDVGCGFGKWGFLLREYLEIFSQNSKIISPRDHFKWQLRIDGIEIYDRYIKQLQREIYNDIYVGDCFDIINRVDSYDLIIMGDVIEHFKKEVGAKLLEMVYKKSTIGVIITTPICWWEQNEMWGNIHEKHLSLWIESDFKEYNPIFIYKKLSMIALLNKSNIDIKERVFRNPFSYKRSIARKQAMNLDEYGYEKINTGVFLKLYFFLKKALSRG